METAQPGTARTAGDTPSAAGAVLAANEARLRALFETTAQGVAIMTLLRDEANDVVDARYLEVNPAFERLTKRDRASVVGRRSSEVFPLDFARWQPRLATVEGTEEPERFESFIPDAGRWFSTYAVPIGEPDAFVVFLDDVTERKRHELQQAFLLGLSDALRPLHDPAAIKLTATRLLGEALEANRVFYADAEDGHWLVAKGYETGVEPLPDQRFAMSTYGDWIIDGFQAGTRLIVPDMHADGRFQQSERDAQLALRIGAQVALPLVKGGELVAMLVAQNATPREWAEREIALLEETAERTWAAVERARAERALQQSEAKYRELFERIDEGFCLIEMTFDGERPVDYRFVEVNPDFERHTGTANAQGRRAEPLRDDAGRIVRWFGAATDVHAQRMALEEAERLAAERTAERDLARRQLLEAEEVERRRLARELHDEAGQHLTALGLGLQTLSDMTPPGSEVDRRATQLRELVATMSRELHSLAVRLRPKSLDDFGLEAALVAYVEEWSRQTDVAVGMHARAGADRLPSEIESAVYRVVQEALTNVARHSGATRASVIVERREGQVVAIVEDDGRGFDADALALMPPDGTGLGLRGIRERAALLGGTADVESTAGAGTTVYLRIPIEPPGSRTRR